MKKRFGEAPLPIDGWLIVIALFQIYLLSSFITLFIQSIYSLLFSTKEMIMMAGVPNIYTLAIAVVAGVLATIGSYLLFKRRFEFKTFFMIQSFIYIGYALVSFILIAIQDLNNEINTVFFNYLASRFSYIIPILISVFCLICIIKSERAKKTFVFTRQNPDMRACSMRRLSNEGILYSDSLPIYGFLIFAVYRLAALSMQAVKRVINSTLDLFYGQADIVLILISLLVMALLIVCIIEFFARSKAGRWWIFVVAILSIAYDLYLIISAYISNINWQDISWQEIPWYYLILDLFNYLIYALNFTLILYILFSRRVKLTFVNPARIHFGRIFKPVWKLFALKEKNSDEFTEELKDKLDAILETYKVQPVGSGYTDLITDRNDCLSLINGLSRIGIRVRAVAWWCFVQEGNEGCPHGIGGPKALWSQGWYSEMTQIKVKEFKARAEGELNADVIDYIQNEFPMSKHDKPCLIPALWLDVPRVWNNIIYK